MERDQIKFPVLDLYWRSPESSEFWYMSSQLKKAIWYLGSHAATAEIESLPYVLPPPGKEGVTQNVLTAFALKSRPDSGLGCLICAIFAHPGSHADAAVAALIQSESEQIVVSETPGLNCRSPDTGELRHKSRESKKAIWYSYQSKNNY